MTNQIVFFLLRQRFVTKKSCAVLRLDLASFVSSATIAYFLLAATLTFDDK